MFGEYLRSVVEMYSQDDFYEHSSMDADDVYAMAEKLNSLIADYDASRLE